MTLCSFRLQEWLMRDLQLVQEQKNCNRTEALHIYISYLKQQARTAKADLETYKQFMQQQKTATQQPSNELIHCELWNQKVTASQCAECMSKRINPECSKVKNK